MALPDAALGRPVPCDTGDVDRKTSARFSVSIQHLAGVVVVCFDGTDR